MRKEKAGAAAASEKAGSRGGGLAMCRTWAPRGRERQRCRRGRGHRLGAMASVGLSFVKSTTGNKLDSVLLDGGIRQR